MSSNDVVIDARQVSKRYEIYKAPHDRLKQLVLPRLRLAIDHAVMSTRMGKARPRKDYFREFWALREVSFQVRRGETLGIIGRNGSGKSTLLQILAGTLTPTSGTVNITGRIAALLELGSGFNPEFTGKENIFLNGRILGLTQKEITDRYDQIVEFADIGDFIDQPVMTYSSGMFVRLAFAVQAHIDASIVIIDEALAVGDIFFRNKCYARLEQLRNAGAAILLVSHSMPDIEQYCERAILLDHGQVLFTGPSVEAAKHYYLLHQGHAQKTAVTALSSAPSITPLDYASAEMRPDPAAYFDIRDKAQIGTGAARCVAVALCNEIGAPSNSFRQGDLAVFYYEFELSDVVEVPVCGLVIKNERGLIVHGKNSWQFPNDVPQGLPAGTRVVCRHEIKLDLGLGEYIFEVGFACVSVQTWAERRQLSHDVMSTRHTRLCHVPDAGTFSIGLAIKDDVAILTHHGVADLPGSMSISAQPAREQ